MDLSSLPPVNNGKLLDVLCGEKNGFRINNDFTLENKVGSVWDSPLEMILVFCLLLHATVCCSIL